MTTRTLASIALFAAIALAWTAASAPAAPKALVEVRATLRGEVLAEGLTKVGDSVSEGDPLVYVRTQTGRSVAARATARLVVTELLPTPPLPLATSRTRVRLPGTGRVSGIGPSIRGLWPMKATRSWSPLAAAFSKSIVHWRISEPR